MRRTISKILQVLIAIGLSLTGCNASKPVLLTNTQCSMDAVITTSHLTILDPILYFDAVGTVPPDLEEVSELKKRMGEKVQTIASERGFTLHSENELDPIQQERIKEAKSLLQKKNGLFKKKRRCRELLSDLEFLSGPGGFVLIAMKTQQKIVPDVGMSGVVSKKSTSNLVVGIINPAEKEIPWIHEAFFRSAPWLQGHNDSSLSSALDDALAMLLSDFPNSPKKGE
jgi:hypothetical protein